MVFWGTNKKKEEDPTLARYGATSAAGDIEHPQNSATQKLPHPANNEDTSKQNGGLGLNNLNPDPSTLPMPELTQEQAKIYRDLQRIQYVMDDAIRIPCTNRKIGIDPIVGLLPFVGDFASAMVSCVLIARAGKSGISGYTMTRMFWNVCIDAAVGTIPLLGDLFDIGWQANQRNVTIFENHMKVGADKQRDIDKCYVCSILLALVGACLLGMVAFSAGFVLLILWLTGTIGSSS